MSDSAMMLIRKRTYKTMQRRIDDLTLEVSLAQIVRNYAILKQQCPAHTDVSAVVKANSYGLGAIPISLALQDAGCNYFFIATIEEGITLRKALGPLPRIFVLTGFYPTYESDYAAYDLIPVLNTLDDIKRYDRFAASLNKALGCILHIDTGLNRLGLTSEEVDRLKSETFKNLTILYVMSHLASSEEMTADQNKIQLERFKSVLSRFPGHKASFANSSAHFLPQDYHFNLTRPGFALYGGNPTPDAPNPMHPVLRCKSRLIQIKTLKKGESVGYNATYHTSHPFTRIGTISAG